PTTTGGSPTIIGCGIPARWYVSAKFTPMALLRRRTWPRPGGPTLISSHTKLSGGPFLWITAAIPMMHSFSRWLSDALNDDGGRLPPMRLSALANQATAYSRNGL